MLSVKGCSQLPYKPRVTRTLARVLCSFPCSLVLPNQLDFFPSSTYLIGYEYTITKTKPKISKEKLLPITVPSIPFWSHTRYRRKDRNEKEEKAVIQRLSMTTTWGSMGKYREDCCSSEAYFLGIMEYVHCSNVYKSWLRRRSLEGGHCKQLLCIMRREKNTHKFSSLFTNVVLSSL